MRVRVPPSAPVSARQPGDADDDHHGHHHRHRRHHDHGDDDDDNNNVGGDGEADGGGAGLGGLVQRPLNPLRDKSRKRPNVEINARAIKGGEIFAPVLDTDHRPRITSRGQHRVHQKARHAPIPIRIRVYVTEQPVTQHGADARIILTLDQIE